MKNILVLLGIAAMVAGCGQSYEEKARIFLENLMPKDLLAEAKKSAPATLQAL